MPDLSASSSAPASSFALGLERDRNADPFVDRRSQGEPSAASERRQFGSTHSQLSEDGRELALAIDQYKLEHRRRYITCDEMLSVIHALGYQKQ